MARWTTPILVSLGISSALALTYCILPAGTNAVVASPEENATPLPTPTQSLPALPTVTEKTTTLPTFPAVRSTPVAPAQTPDSIPSVAPALPPLPFLPHENPVVSEEKPSANDPTLDMIRRELGIKTTVLEPKALDLDILKGTARNDSPSNEPPKEGRVVIPASVPPVHLKPVPSLTLPKLSYVNSPEIAVEYEVTRRGRTGIQAVELWATRDEGKTWERYEQTKETVSPLRTRLAGEGIYGLAVVFVGGGNQTSPLPKKAEDISLRVEVDRTPPSLTLQSPQLDAENPQEMKIMWEVADKNLHDKPIRLEYSSDGEHWHSIHDADWLAECKEYRWQMPVGVSNDVHLRVTARDRAGNQTEVRNPKMVTVDLIVPAGRLTRLETVGSSTDREPLPRPRVIATEPQPTRTTWMLGQRIRY